MLDLSCTSGINIIVRDSHSVKFGKKIIHLRLNSNLRMSNFKVRFPCFPMKYSGLWKSYLKRCEGPYKMSFGLSRSIFTSVRAL